MPIAQTSILSFYSLDHAKVNTLQREIYNLIKKDKTLSNRDIATILGLEICTVTGRVNELCEMGLIVSWAVKKDLRTNRTVKIWKAVQ
jgi:predicted transcriptional regulator